MKLGPHRYVKARGPTSSFPWTAPNIVTTGPGLEPWIIVIGIGQESPISTSKRLKSIFLILPGFILLRSNR